MAEAEGSKPTIPVQDVEALIRSIQGITDCRIVINDWGGVEEVHILAGAERNARMMVRDVQSALQARFGIDVEHKKISIAQIGTGTSKMQVPFRLQIKSHSLQVNWQAQRTIIKVELVDPGGEVLSGEASGQMDHHSPMHMAANAALSAINQLLRAPRSVSLNDVQKITVGGRPLVIAVVEYGDGRAMPEVLVGSALLHGDEVHSCIKAVLDSINRRLAVKDDVL